MARDLDSAQDAEMHRNDKLNRMNPDARKVKVLTLKEQMDAQAILDRMTPGERLANMEWSDWERLLGEHIQQSRTITVPQRAYRAVLANYRTDLEKFHKDGTPLGIVAKFCQDSGEQYLRW
jgi:hypothetical protein